MRDRGSPIGRVDLGQTLKQTLASVTFWPQLRTELNPTASPGSWLERLTAALREHWEQAVPATSCLRRTAAMVTLKAEALEHYPGSCRLAAPEYYRLIA